MSITYIEGTVRGPKGEERVRVLVDSGATYTLLPESIWRKIGLSPKREHSFVLADGPRSRGRSLSATSFCPRGRGTHL